MVAVFCRDCREKLYDLSDINEDKRSTCPNCGSGYRFYHLTFKPVGDSTDIRIIKDEVDNRYINVSVCIFDTPDRSKLTVSQQAGMTCPH